MFNTKVTSDMFNYMIFILLAYVMAGSCVSAKEFHLPINIPFKVQNKNSSIEFEMVIDDPGYYSFLLDYYDSKSISRLDLVNLLRSQAGSSSVNQNTNKCLSIPVYLSVVDIKDNRSIINNRYEDHDMYSYSDKYISQEIVKAHLSAGRYSVTAKSVCDIVVLSRMHIDLSVRKTYMGK